MKQTNLLPLITALALLFIACEPQKAQQQKLIIATAANMQYAMDGLCQAFTKQTGIACDLVVSSSGKLTAQIMEGAPYDVFVAADMKYPYALYKQGLAQNPPQIYAYGQLVLWAMKDEIQPLLANLSSNSVNHIAIANPKTAPYGNAAMAVLNYHQLLDHIEDKLVYGESISQTNQFIISMSADLGFTALSVVLSPEMKGKGRWIILDKAWYSPIEQGVVVIKRKERSGNQAQQFYAFLFSEEAKQLLVNFGYAMDK